jgi:hypothetical protein
MRIIISLLASILAATTVAGQTRADDLLPVTTDGQKWGFANASGKQVIAPQFDAALPFSNGFAAVKVSGKWGFIRPNGTFLVQPQFDQVKLFANGKAPVLKEHSWKYLQMDGTATPWVGDWMDAGPFSNGRAPVQIGHQWIYIDEAGKKAINGSFEESRPFHDGLAAVKIDGKYGFVDPTGRNIVKPTFDEVSDFHNGHAAVNVAGHWGYLDAKGELVIQPRFDVAGPFIDGKAKVVTGGVAGELNTNGTVKTVASVSSPLIQYHIDSSPTGAQVYVIPLLQFLKLKSSSTNVLNSNLISFYLRGTTGTDVDLFDQKYMIILVIGSDVRMTLLDVVAGSHITSLTIRFK